MRSRNAIKNLAIYIVYEAFVFILGIVFPRYIILQYGSEINGLTSTITRILSLINLIQSGAVGAAIYQMYKPVAQDDWETQSAIIYSSKRYYSKFLERNPNDENATFVIKRFAKLRHPKSANLSLV